MFNVAVIMGIAQYRILNATCSCDNLIHLFITSTSCNPSLFSLLERGKCHGQRCLVWDFSVPPRQSGMHTGTTSFQFFGPTGISDEAYTLNQQHTSKR